MTHLKFSANLCHNILQSGKYSKRNKRNSPDNDKDIFKQQWLGSLIWSLQVFKMVKVHQNCILNCIYKCILVSSWDPQRRADFIFLTRNCQNFCFITILHWSKIFFERHVMKVRFELDSMKGDAILNTKSKVLRSWKIFVETKAHKYKFQKQENERIHEKTIYMLNQFVSQLLFTSFITCDKKLNTGLRSNL